MKLIKVKCRDGREDFLKRLSEAMWRTIRIIRESPTVCATEHKKMFEKLPAREAQDLLNEAKKYNEFDPLRIEQYQKIINQK